MSQNLIEEIHQSFKINSSRIALTSGETAYTYKDFQTAVYFISGLLNTNSCQKVAVIGEPSFLTAVSVVSALLSEAAYIPIEPFWPLKRINKILNHSRAEAVFSYSTTLKKHSLDLKDFVSPVVFQIQTPAKDSLNLKKESGKTLSIEKYVHTQLRETYVLSSHFKFLPFSKKTSSSLAYIMYTSGSTGEPKGVKVSVSALQKFLYWIREEFQISSLDRFSYTASLGFGASIRQIFSPLLSGAQSFCFSPETVKSPSLFLKELKQKQISLLNVPPVLLQHLAEQSKKENRDKDFLSSVRLVLAGGDLFPTKTLDLWYSQFYHPHSVINLYGSTESIVNASFYQSSKKNRGSPSHNILPIGQPRPGFSFFLRNEQGQIIDKENEVGELCIQSSFLSQGYYNNEKESKKTFSPLKNNQRIYYTGDRAVKLPSKDYLVLGRKDTQVQIYGQRLELGEIENSLNSHPQVQRACVVHFREKGFDKLCAYIQTKDPQRYNEKELRDFLSTELTSYMIPHEFQQVDQIPTTGTNKVDYKVLKDRAQNRLIDPLSITAIPQEKKPLHDLTDEELTEKIKHLWQKYLDKKQLSEEDSFFDVGGDSVLAVSLYQSLCEYFKINMEPYVFYTAPTIKNIRKALRQSQKGRENQNTEKMKTEREQKQLSQSQTGNYKNIFSSRFFQNSFLEIFFKTLKFKNKIMSYLYRTKSIPRGPQSPQQKSFVFMKQIFNETYNGFFSVPVQGHIDKKAFNKVLHLIIQSQESLRTLLIGEEQIVLPEGVEDTLFYDLKNHTDLQQKEIIRQTENKLLNQKFDFSRLPPFKLALLELYKDRYHLIFCINHVAGDGWSLQAFLSQLNKSYAFLKNKGPAPTLHSYLSYTKHYKVFCKNHFHNNQRFWTDKLNDLASYNLSSKFQNFDSLSPEENLTLTSELSQKISLFAKKQKTQNFYIYLALWTKSFKEFLNCSKVLFWTTYHGRDFPFKNLNTMIGSIARVAPLLIDIENQNLKELIQKVQWAYRESLKHKDFNITKPFLSDKNNSGVTQNWVGFNYLDFKPLESLTKDIPFYMDFTKVEIQLSSSQKSYQRLYLFFSIHHYKDHLDLRVYGKALQEHKKEILYLMKNNFENLG